MFHILEDVECCHGSLSESKSVIYIRLLLQCSSLISVGNVGSHCQTTGPGREVCRVIVCSGAVTRVTTDRHVSMHVLLVVFIEPKLNSAFHIPGCRPCLTGGIIRPRVCQEDRHMSNHCSPCQQRQTILEVDSNPYFSLDYPCWKLKETELTKLCTHICPQMWMMRLQVLTFVFA